jgi:tetratricopeptide (TPR) repeat protein
MKPPRVDEALEYATAEAALRPRSWFALNHLGFVLSMQGRHDDAIAAYREAIRLDPGNSSKSHFNLGVILIVNGEIDESIVEFREAIRLDPGLAVAHGNLGVALKDKGKSDEAIAAYREAIRLDPGNSSRSHNNLGIALKDKGKIDEAIAEYREAIRLEPGLAQAHMNLGIVFCDLKHDYAAAESEFRTVIRLTPDAEGLIGVGGFLRSNGQFEQAIAAYREAIRKKPDFAVAHNNLADTLNMHPDPARREPEVAIVHARKATELNPKDGPAFNTLGVAHYRGGQVESALTALHKSMELRQGGDPYDWFFLAMIEHGRGHADEAGRWFDKSVAWIKQQKAPDAGLLPIWTEAAKVLGRRGPEPLDQAKTPDPKTKP